MGDILHSVDSFDLVELLDFRGESTMKAEHLVLDQCGEGQTHEDLGEEFPNGLSPIFLQTLIIETVLTVYLAVLVVTTEEGYTVAVFYFED
jgi:hypothetical protein